MTMRGVDVSKHQGVIDWPTAFAHGVEFALCKATQGLDEVDAQAARNMAELRRLGFRRGWYHFPDASNDPAAEAAKFLHVVGAGPGEVRMLDVENDDYRDARTHVFGAVDTVAWVTAWCSEVLDAVGSPPLVYLSGANVTAFDWSPLVKLDCGLVVADWDNPNPDPGPWPFWAIHQDTNAAHFPGIAAPVDSDVFNGDGKAWDKYAGTTGTKPGPLPKPKPGGPPADVPQVYVTVKGDNLWTLAERFGVTVDQLVAWNDHAYPTLRTNHGLIFPGWRLVVGVHGHTAPPHVVQANDTLSGIASDWGVKLDAVKAANPQLGPPHRNWDVIFPGDVVRHP